MQKSRYRLSSVENEKRQHRPRILVLPLKMYWYMISLPQLKTDYEAFFPARLP